MADDQQTKISAGRFLQKEIPNLRLGDEIEHRCRFIAQQKAKLWTQHPRDAKALQFPSGKLGRIPLQPPLLDVQSIEHAFFRYTRFSQRLSQP